MAMILSRAALSLSLVALTACGYTVEPGPVTREFSGNVSTVKGSFVLKEQLFGSSSMRGGGCLTYADPSKVCGTDTECGGGHCLAYRNDSPEKVCWRGVSEPSACNRRPMASNPLVPGEVLVVTYQEAFVSAPSTSYWRVITCQPYEDGSCHQTGLNGKKLYRLAYGPVRSISHVKPEL